jgi:hypothetical protein
MNLNYSQTTGHLTKDSGEFIAEGWAGNGKGKNNPSMQNAKSVGPLPRGIYQVGPWEELHTGLGPLVAHLTMISGESFGRDAFYIHGPAVDPSHYGQESKGCIVIPREGRKCVKCLNPTTITVTE